MCSIEGLVFAGEMSAAKVDLYSFFYSNLAIYIYLSVEDTLFYAAEFFCSLSLGVGWLV